MCILFYTGSLLFKIIACLGNICIILKLKSPDVRKCSALIGSGEDDNVYICAFYQMRIYKYCPADIYNYCFRENIVSR